MPLNKDLHYACSLCYWSTSVEMFTLLLGTAYISTEVAPVSFERANQFILLKKKNMGTLEALRNKTIQF